MKMFYYEKSGEVVAEDERVVCSPFVFPEPFKLTVGPDNGTGLRFLNRGNEVEAVLVSEERLNKARRRLEDAIRKDRRKLVAALESANIEI